MRLTGFGADIGRESQKFAIFMPGAASCLDHHEWYKHGTCSGMSADAYFALTNGLVASFAQTDFNQYVAGHIGSEVSRSDLLKGVRG